MVEPPSRVDFINSTGAYLICQAIGKPKPVITWLKKDGSLVTDVPKLRQTFSNGTLVLYPFRAEDYREDIHTTYYRCLAKNTMGSVVSKLVLTRGGKYNVYLILFIVLT